MQGARPRAALLYIVIIMMSIAGFRNVVSYMDGLMQSLTAATDQLHEHGKVVDRCMVVNSFLHHSASRLQVQRSDCPRSHPGLIQGVSNTICQIPNLHGAKC